MLKYQIVHLPSLLYFEDYIRSTFERKKKMQLAIRGINSN